MVVEYSPIPCHCITVNGVDRDEPTMEAEASCAVFVEETYEVHVPWDGIGIVGFARARLGERDEAMMGEIAES